MTGTIVLDGGSLGLIVQKVGLSPADECREWVARHIDRGVRVVVPEIVDHELRRELLRMDKIAAVRRLDHFIADAADRYLPLTTPAMLKAAELWADVRRRGLPTADPKGLDGDTILAAQVLTTLEPAGEVVIATTNAVRLRRFVRAELWSAV